MIRRTLFQSRIGRRIFCLFICCSIVPIVILAVLAFNQVSRNLEEQSSRRLSQSTKAFSLSLLERLTLLDNELLRTGAEYEWEVEMRHAHGEENLESSYLGRFEGICLYRNSKEPVPLVGALTDLPPIPGETLAQLSDEKAAIFALRRSSQESRLFLVRLMKSRKADLLLVGEIDTSYLWSVGTDNTLPPMTDLCVVDQSGKPLISSISDPAPLLYALASAQREPGKRQFEWEFQGTANIASYWTLFLKGRFVSPNWTVMLSESKADIFAPLEDFKAIFPGIILLSLLVVAFLSMHYIRQTLVPLEQIKEGIKQISKHDFDTRITVSSRDEFQDLAATFNEMSRQLGRQFKALTTKSEIDRAILSSLDTNRIISTALIGIQGFLGCERISINLLDPAEPHMATSYFSKAGNEVPEASMRVRFTASEIMEIYSRKEYVVIPAEAPPPGYLSAIDEEGTRFFLVLPVYVKNRLAATINMAYMNVEAPPDDDLLHARQLADQIAVAFSNSSLIEELDQLNWGTLKALARTVDAKSSWTAGHSERVFEVAMRIGGVLELAGEELDILHRGALLHDIGKVGIPGEILDKPSRLTDEEYQIVKSHSRIGARILEPIASYREVIPLVLQHHERYDGAGYPDGLAGEDIHLGSRILAVADVFDAMVANRPYRSGLALDVVLTYIREEAGKHFDPAIVGAFMTVVATQQDLMDLFHLPLARQAR